MSLTYVALGDSYAAGVGSGYPINGCWRTADGYPMKVAAALGVDLDYEACIGATVPDIERDQLQALGAETAYVTITVGGNDIGFVPTLVACAAPAWMGDDEAAIDAALRAIRGELPSRLDRLYAEVVARAPRARVVVTDYPQLFRGIDCNLATFFTTSELTRLNEAADALAQEIEAAARRWGFDVVGVRPAFGGHEVCAQQEWIRGVSWDLVESFHPNERGHAAYGDLVTRELRPSARRAPGAREPRIVYGRARRGSAPTFALPDLLSLRSLVGAARAGLDVREVAALARRTAGPRARGGAVGVAAGGVADHGADAAVGGAARSVAADRADVAAAWARLHELDEEVRAARMS